MTRLLDTDSTAQSMKSDAPPPPPPPPPALPSSIAPTIAPTIQPAPGPAATVAPLQSVGSATSMTSSTPPAFPPPDLLGAPTDLSAQKLRTVTILLGLAAVAALVLGMLWLSAGRAKSDADAARDAATIERDQVVARATGSADALIATQAELDTALATNIQLRENIDASAASADDLAAAIAANATLDADVATLTARNGEMLAEIERLQAVIDAAPEPAAVVEPSAPTVFDIASSPDFARYIGEQLSTHNGRTNLGQGQSTCFGTAVINAIGLDGLGQGLRSEASGANQDIVAAALLAAADACGIDRTAI